MYHGNVDKNSKTHFIVAYERDEARIEIMSIDFCIVFVKREENRHDEVARCEVRDRID